MRLILFDCDGTLVDAAATIVAAFQLAFSTEGLEAPEPAAIRHTIGLPLVDSALALRPDLSARQAVMVAENYRTAVRAMRAHQGHAEPLYEDMARVVAELAGTDVLGIVTGKGRPGLGRTLIQHGLERFFTVTFTADDGPGKPNPWMVEEAMRQTGFAPSECIVVGDTAFDMGMARAAGVRALGVTWGYHREEELKASGADAICDMPGRLVAAIDAVLPRRQNPAP